MTISFERHLNPNPTPDAEREEILKDEAEKIRVEAMKAAFAAEERERRAQARRARLRRDGRYEAGRTSSDEQAR